MGREEHFDSYERLYIAIRSHVMIVIFYAIVHRANEIESIHVFSEMASFE
jgi:hypothetical protein